MSEGAAATVRAWMLRRTGGPSALTLEEIPTPRPGPGEVAVDVDAIGVNYAEVLSRKGLYGWAPKRPYTPGMECAGRIVEVGAGVGRAVGEEVVIGTQYGAYAERIVVPAARALPALPTFSTRENAAFAVNFTTAWVSLMEMARARPTDRVAITAAAGGVGTAAVQIASAYGCEVLALAGSEEKLARTVELGADATVEYRSPGFEKRFDRAVAERRPDVVLESVGGDVYDACFERLATFGRIVVLGYASLDYTLWNPVSWYRALKGIPRINLPKAAESSVGALATHVGYLLPDEERLGRLWAEMTAFVREHGLRPVVGATYAFEDLPEAHRFMESRKSVGKIVVRV